MQRLTAVVVLDQRLDVLHPVRLLARRTGRAGRVQLQLLVDRAHVLAMADVLVVVHRQQHVVSAQQRRIRVEVGVVGRGRLRQARNHRRLGDAEILAMLREVHLGRGLAAVGDPAVGDDVEIGGEDLVLRPLIRHLHRQPRFLDLAGGGGVVVEIEVAYDLLLEGRGALDDVAGVDVVDRSAEDALEVHPAVLVEAPVLDVHGGLLEPRRDLRRGDGSAVLRRGDLVQQRAVRGIDLGVDARIVRRHRVQVEPVDHAVGSHTGAGRAAHRERHEHDPQHDQKRCDQRAIVAPAIGGTALAAASADDADGIVVAAVEAVTVAGIVGRHALRSSGSVSRPSASRRARQRSRSQPAVRRSRMGSSTHTPTL